MSGGTREGAREAQEGASPPDSGVLIGQQPVSEELALEHGMTADEYARVCEIVGRTPTVTEVGMFSVMWSEHCSYKSSRVHLKTLPTEGPAVVEGPGENAGAVDLGDGWAAVFKVESHNHPSYIEPYQGAATGVGGILRDIFTMGARPLALLNSLRFGTLDKAKNRFLLEGVVGGIAGYGNCIGVPTVGGEIYFDPSYDHNPLVNVMCYGLVPSDRIVRARASGLGNPVLYVGAKTGRDGIYGVSLLASATFDEGAEEKRPAVQVGDPFTEKLLLESCLELIERGLVVGMQDMGGAGLTCSTCEMGSKAGTGMEIDVRKVPTRERGMSAYEFMLSESQERMLLVCEREDLQAVQAVFEKWDLHAVEIGVVTGDGLLRVKDGEAVVAEMPARSLADDGPVYRRPFQEPQAGPRLGPGDVAPLWELPGHTASGAACRRALLDLLADPSIASKRWVFQQYDQTVRTNTVQRPGGDAAVMRIKETGGAVALSLDGNPWHTGLDPEAGAALAVAEACRNVACTGARPLGITNCLNFGSPESEERMGQFSAAVRGLGAACRALGVPVTGGNVSFYNETESRPILPTPVIGCLGHLADANLAVPSAFQAAGDAIVLLGVDVSQAAGDVGDWGLGGSALLRVCHRAGAVRGAPPAIDLQREAALQRVLVEAAEAGLLRSAHDCSDGGLGVALAEACFGRADDERADGCQGSEALGSGLFGAAVDLGPGTAGRVDLRLFGEAASRVVVSLPPESREALSALCARHGLPASEIGVVSAGAEGGDDAVLEVSCGEAPLFELEVRKAYVAWATSLAEKLGRGKGRGKWDAA
ncbi:MAG TPA: phosphoribosylformylglycinamidine synthase subunit PurL [Acidobacteriota bacterium]